MGSVGAGRLSCSHHLVDSCILEAERSPYCFHRAGLVFEEYFHAGRGALDLSVWRRPHQCRSTAYAALTLAAQIRPGLNPDLCWIARDPAAIQSRRHKNEPVIESK